MGRSKLVAGDWFQNDELFFSELEKGYRYTVEMGRRLRLLGISVTVPEMTKRETIDDRVRFASESDLVVPGEPNFIVEVKSRDLVFNCAHDYPYATALVDTVAGWDQKSPKPIAVILVSQQTLGTAVIRGSSAPSWTVKSTYDRKRHVNDRWYQVPREQLVGFGALIDHLRRAGRSQPSEP